MADSSVTGPPGVGTVAVGEGVPSTGAAVRSGRGRNEPVRLGVGVVRAPAVEVRARVAAPERFVVAVRPVRVCFAVDFFAADFFAVAVFAVDFLAVAFLTVDVFPVGFFAGAFLAVDFFAVVFFAVVFFAAVFFTVVFFDVLFFVGAFRAVVFCAVVFFAVDFFVVDVFAAGFRVAGFFAALRVAGASSHVAAGVVVPVTRRSCHRTRRRGERRSTAPSPRR